MKTESRNTISRRTFLGATASTAFAFSILPGKVLGQDAPSNKLNIGMIGVGGRGAPNLAGVAGENIVAICDVDLQRAGNNIRKYPKAKVYRDFRVMLEKQKDLDAVVVSIPDHAHYVAAIAAMQMGKHVYCEKPLAHSIFEVRQLVEAARKYKVATQMGVQGHSSEDIRRCCEWTWDGAIGEVREVHAWSNRPMGGYAFPSGVPRPKDTPPVPDTLDWDLWLGPAKFRPYHPIYAPIYWRGWLDFGTGALGDMGCHILDPAFWALKLGSPTSVEAHTSYNPDPEFWRSCLKAGESAKVGIPDYLEELRQESYPVASIVRYEFPARGAMPPVKLTWYDGGMLPPRPPGMTKGLGGNGALIIGSKGTIHHGSHGAAGCKIVPDERMKEYLAQPAPQTIKRVEDEDHHKDWIAACKGGEPAGANFDYGGPLAEIVLLGIIAMRDEGTRLKWDGAQMQFTNSKEANALIKPTYREGWSLQG